MSTNEMTIAAIDHNAKDYADARKRLTERVTDLKSEHEKLTRKALPGIREAVAAATVARSVLERALLAGKHLFVEPRTFTLHGVKVGFQKGKGSLAWDDDETLVARIEKLFPGRAGVLLRVKKEPNAEALAQLDGETLKTLGVSIVAAGDAVVIRDATSNVDKLVAKLLEEDATERATTIAKKETAAARKVA